MTDTRIRVPLNGKTVDLARLDTETGGHGLCANDTEVVAVEGSPITAADLAAAIAAHTPPARPLDPVGVVATLNAVTGVWTLTDAANAVHLPEQALINEAMAWASLVG